MGLVDRVYVVDLTFLVVSYGPTLENELQTIVIISKILQLMGVICQKSNFDINIYYSIHIIYKNTVMYNFIIKSKNTILLIEVLLYMGFKS